MLTESVTNAGEEDQAESNGTWYNTRILRGQTHGPVSGDAITKQIAYGAASRAVTEAARRPAIEIAAR